MRLLDLNAPEQYQPLDRGNAFPQYYENGDKYDCHSNAFDWHHHFWHGCVQAWEALGKPESKIVLMGGEL